MTVLDETLPHFDHKQTTTADLLKHLLYKGYGGLMEIPYEGVVFYGFVEPCQKPKDNLWPSPQPTHLQTMASLFYLQIDKKK